MDEIGEEQSKHNFLSSFSVCQAKLITRPGDQKMISALIPHHVFSSSSSSSCTNWMIYEQVKEGESFQSKNY